VKPWSKHQARINSGERGCKGREKVKKWKENGDLRWRSGFGFEIWHQNDKEGVLNPPSLLWFQLRKFY
jgi:hypothetical protein